MFRRFPPPSSRTYQLHYIGAEAREEGGTRCQRALAAEWDRGAEKIGQQEVAETASGCPKRWCWSKRRTGGTEDSLPCSWDEEGWLPSERERRSRRRSPVGRSLLPSARLVEEQGPVGLAAGCPRLEEPSPARQEAEGASGRPPKEVPVPSHGTASEPLSWLRTEWQCVRNRTEIFFFFSSLPSLFSVTPHHPSVSFSRLVCPYPQVHRGRPDGLPPGRGGRGGSRAQSREYPRPARGDGVCDEWGGAESRGNGARPVE